MAEQNIRIKALASLFDTTIDMNTATVRTLDGVLEGEKIKNPYGGTYYSFKGIPYAKPPLGDLRFKAPQPVEPWHGIRRATEFGPVSYQYDVFFTQTIIGNEDCLYLNVYTPNLSPKQLLPVMVYLHGGGFFNGSGNDDLYGPEFLVKKDVILVTLNYRLGILGYLSLETEEIPGNAGMKDQVAALRWVQKNIKNFGGDPSNVTLFGESAGGACVSFHLISPMSKGLFKHAIVQSTVSTGRVSKCVRPRDRALTLAKRLGFYSEDDKEVAKFLKSQPMESFLDHNLQITLVEKHKEKIETFVAIVDEKQFGNNERFFYEDLKLEIHEDVNVMLGYCEHEGILCLFPGFQKIADQANFYPEFFVPNPICFKTTTSEQIDIGKTIKKYYFGDEMISKKNIDQLIDFFSADLYWYALITFSRTIAAQNKGQIYVYKFTAKSKRNVVTKILDTDKVLDEDKIYVCHGDELTYMFPTTLWKSPEVEPNSRESHLIDKVTKLWTDFAKFGCPTPDNSMGVQWLPFTKEKQNFVHIDDTLVADCNPEEEKIRFWDKIFAPHFPEYAF